MSETVLQDQDREILVELERIFQSVRAKIIKAAPLLAKLSRPGLKEAKLRLKKFVGAEHIDRLVAFHRGDIPEHLALRDGSKSLRFSYYLQLKPKAKEILNNANNQVMLATPKGSIVKTIAELNILEMHQVFSRGYDGQVPLEKQKEILLKRNRIVQVETTKDDKSLPTIEEFRIAGIPGAKWLILTIDGVRSRISGEKFKHSAKYFV